jgi:hypothetical protein
MYSVDFYDCPLNNEGAFYTGIISLDTAFWCILTFFSVEVVKMKIEMLLSPITKRRKSNQMPSRLAVIPILIATALLVLPATRFGRQDYNSTVFAAEDQSFQPPKPAFEYLGRWTVDLKAPVWELGQVSDLGKRRIIPITGGTFEGPGIKGKILNNGADWQIVRKDGVAVIDTRYLLQTDDGELVYLQTKGYRYGPPEILAKLSAGESVDPSLYYFRVTMQFETSAAKYDYLNRAIGIAFAMRLKDAVVYDAYLIK